MLFNFLFDLTKEIIISGDWDWGSYSNFPTSYWKGNPTNELTGKNPNFRIADVEVYQVSYEE